MLCGQAGTCHLCVVGSASPSGGPHKVHKVVGRAVLIGTLAFGLGTMHRPGFVLKGMDASGPEQAGAGAGRARVIALLLPMLRTTRPYGPLAPRTCPSRGL